MSVEAPKTLEEVVATVVASIVVWPMSYFVLTLSELSGPALPPAAVETDAVDDLWMTFCGSYLNTLPDDVVDVIDEGV